MTECLANLISADAVDLSVTLPYNQNMANTQKRPVKRDTKILDPLHFLPEGVDELEFDRGGVYVDEDSETVLFDDIGVDVGPGIPGGTEQLATPRILGIVSQTVKTQANGAQTVTVVLDVTDVLGAVNYEFKVARL